MQRDKIRSYTTVVLPVAFVFTVKEPRKTRQVARRVLKLVIRGTGQG